MNTGSDILNFILRSTLFLLLFGCFTVTLFYTKYSNIPFDKLIGKEVYVSIKKSKEKKSRTKTLIIGDSIAKQMYDNEERNDTINSFACVQGVSVFGQYLLLKDFLETNPKLKPDVIFLYRPSSFRNNLDQGFSFNYFLKPFLKKEYLPSFSDLVWKQIKKIPFYQLSKYEIVKQSNWSPSYNLRNNPHDFVMSEISAKYLKGCKELCEKYGASFRVECTFMSDEFKSEEFSKMKEQISHYELNELFEGYFDDIVYLDNNLFADGRHLKKSVKRKVLGDNFLGI